jgi:hypothetical protein
MTCIDCLPIPVVVTALVSYSLWRTADVLEVGPGRRPGEQRIGAWLRNLIFEARPVPQFIEVGLSVLEKQGDGRWC